MFWQAPIIQIGGTFTKMIIVTMVCGIIVQWNKERSPEKFST